MGDGRRGTARWATPEEIKQTCAHVPFRPVEWRKGTNLPKVQGSVLGSAGKKRVTALVDGDDLYCVRFVP